MRENLISRRRFLQNTACLASAAAFAARAPAAPGEQLPPIRAITGGPKFHWFSYYDKLQFDPSGARVLAMEVDFEHRSPGPDDVISVGMVDLADNDRWIELGKSRSWCWQQGCMLQWRPGSTDEILWNDRRDDRFVCRILNVKTGEKRTLPYPIYEAICLFVSVLFSAVCSGWKKYFPHFVCVYALAMPIGRRHRHN